MRQLGQHKAWFRRLPDGQGERLGPRRDDLPLPAAAFPPLGLKTDWPNDRERELALDYLAWLAPHLLMLQDLDDGQRAWLEDHACRRAVELAAGYRLIPHILNPQRIEAARVEARLRNAAR